MHSNATTVLLTGFHHKFYTYCDAFFVAIQYPIDSFESIYIDLGALGVFTIDHRQPLLFYELGRRILYVIHPVQSIHPDVSSFPPCSIQVPIKAFTTLRPRNHDAAKFLDTQHRARLCSGATFTGETWIVAPAGGGKTTLLLDIVKALPKTNFLFVTFSKTLQQETLRKARTLKLHRHLTCRTYDSLVYTACESIRKSSDILPMTDMHITETFCPYSKPWYKKSGRKHIAHVIQLHLMGLLDHPCKEHKSYGNIDHITNSLTTLEYFTFAGARAHVFTNPHINLVPKNIDVVLIDEFQDLPSSVFDVLRRAGKPMVIVGDPNQRIYQFQSETDCKCTLKTPPPINPINPLSLYVSFRVPSSAHAFIQGQRGTPFLTETSSRLCTGAVLHIS